MQNDLNTLVYAQYEADESTDYYGMVDEWRSVRQEASYDNRNTIRSVIDKAVRAYREGVDCPVQPMLCYDKMGCSALCLACLTRAKHYVAMSRLDMYTPGYYEDEKTFELLRNTGANKRIYGIELSGKTKRVEWRLHQYIFNRKIKLPIDKVRAGVAKLNMRMVVDGYDDLLNCPFVPVTCAEAANFSV